MPDKCSHLVDCHLGLRLSRGTAIEDMDAVALEAGQTTGIPVAVPDVLPSLDESTPVYATLLTAEDGEYEINIGYAPECTGGNACSYGNLAGKRADGAMAGTRNFPYDLHGAKAVTLSENVKGYFIESQCGANCDDAKVFWIRNGFQYMVGIKAGSEEEAVRMANSAIHRAAAAEPWRGTAQ